MGNANCYSWWDSSMGQDGAGKGIVNYGDYITLTMSEGDVYESNGTFIPSYDYKVNFMIAPTDGVMYGKEALNYNSDFLLIYIDSSASCGYKAAAGGGNTTWQSSSSTSATFQFTGSTGAVYYGDTLGLYTGGLSVAYVAGSKQFTVALDDMVEFTIDAGTKTSYESTTCSYPWWGAGDVPSGSDVRYGDTITFASSDSGDYVNGSGGAYAWDPSASNTFVIDSLSKDRGSAAKYGDDFILTTADSGTACGYNVATFSGGAWTSADSGESATYTLVSQGLGQSGTVAYDDTLIIQSGGQNIGADLTLQSAAQIFRIGEPVSMLQRAGIGGGHRWPVYLGIGMLLLVALLFIIIRQR